LPPPIADYEKTLDPQRLALIKQAFRHSVVGGPETIAKGVRDFIARYRPDEVIVTAQIYDHAARLRSIEILSATLNLGAAAPAARPGA
jgi:alkanesulfonate monooxygenase SsuD/methylene tetrahydromethanopterin reductase-like flavin-dependent oxidoreductase (luciferase family)